MNWWQNRQKNDPYRKKRDNLKVLARSYFKIEEIEKKFQIIPNNSIVLDLGSSPGSWCEFFIKKSAKIIAIDLLPLKIQHESIQFIQDNIFNDFLSKDIKLQVIASDISPNLSGNNDIDNSIMERILERIYELQKKHLNLSGNLIFKLFTHQENFARELFKEKFQKTCIFKPHSSRSESSEIYFIAQNKL